MEVVTAKSAGFCFGVRRAVDTVYDLSSSEKKIYTYGPIIHNETVVDDLGRRGVGIVNSLDEIRGLNPAETVIVIRSHGVSELIYNEIADMGFEIVDTTCPFVKRIHDAVREASENGEEILILGSPEHPEVQGIMGWCHGPVQTIEDVESARGYKPLTDRPVTLVSQTTFNHKKFEDIVEILISAEYNVNVMNTICNAT
ncbi:MAG: 4-hydroxy-3-methylbut-2-enyl diphosphate reductase, partial [Lachnospiraceae bacterium]|nr:4-hydroxy-3-methylbut-2-enyl diphosphate reductase [Lachnospiraceae bacterium]